MYSLYKLLVINISNMELLVILFLYKMIIVDKIRGVAVQFVKIPG